MTGRLIAVVSLVLMLAGCGQKGPLYHPAPEPPKAVENSAAQGSSQSSDQGVDHGDEQPR